MLILSVAALTACKGTVQIQTRTAWDNMVKAIAADNDSDFEKYTDAAADGVDLSAAALRTKAGEAIAGAKTGMAILYKDNAPVIENGAPVMIITKIAAESLAITFCQTRISCLFMKYSLIESESTDTLKVVEIAMVMTVRADYILSDGSKLSGMMPVDLGYKDAGADAESKYKEFDTAKGYFTVTGGEIKFAGFADTDLS